MLRDPPDIDPCEHAIESRHWGACSCYLVRYQGRYYAWMAAAAGRPLVYPTADEAAARRFLDDWQAANLLHTPRDETVVHVFLLDPGGAPEIVDTRGRAAASAGDTGGGARIIYHSAVIDVDGEGIWVASDEDTGDDDEAGDPRHRALHTPARFDDLGPALDAFAARAEQAADRVERERVSIVPEVVAGVLRYRAAEARAAAARARVDDAVRRAEGQLRAARSISPLASAIGVSREFLYRVLAAMSGPGPAAGAPARPARACRRRPVTTHATYTVGDHQFALVSYTDSEGGKCVAVDQDGQHGAWVCDVEVSTKRLINAGMAMASQTMGQGLAAVYGRAHDSVTGLYAIMRSGERVPWPIHHDPRNQERYFAVIADCQELKDIVAVAGRRRRTSLKDNFGIWFRAAP
jgi:hypothetical protein